LRISDNTQVFLRSFNPHQESLDEFHGVPALFVLLPLDADGSALDLESV